MHLLLTGASGLVGSATLHAMLHNPAISRITIFARSPVLQASDSLVAREKCIVHTHPDFNKPPSQEVLHDLLRDGAHGMVWALGVSQAQVNDHTYKTVTYDWPVTWARAITEALSAQGDEAKKSTFNFVFVSGRSVTTTPGMFTAKFGRVKGRAEVSLLDINNNHTNAGFRFYSARAGAVDPFNHPEILQYYIARNPVAHKATRALFSVLRVTSKNLMCPTQPLGNALMKLATGNGGPLEGDGITGEGRTLSNERLMSLGKLD